jgi:acetolactate synthase-1/3 small subunit
MTLVVRGDEFVLEQVVKQLHKLIDVIKVIDLTQENHVERELVLMRVNAEPQHRAEILRTADIFRAKVVDVTSTTFTLEATGDEPKLSAFVELMRPMGIQELVRTGKVAIARGSKTARRRVEEPPLGKPADTQRRRRETEASRDQRVTGFAD